MTRTRRVLFLVALIVAGEAVYGLPFVIARIFRPTLLDVFGITNLQLGSAFSLYGVVAMLAYFPGGPLADRFSARRMVAVALLVTALGGLVYAQIPSLGTLTLLFAFWGVSTILLFWSALLRATRQWGGDSAQGRAFGLLDAGRGLAAALMASLTVALFAWVLPSGAENATLAERSQALSAVIYFFTGITIVAAGLVWWWVPEEAEAQGRHAGSVPEQPPFELSKALSVLRIPSLWLQALIVVCAYVGYKSTDDFSLFARDGFGMNDVEAATVGTISFYIRPIAALAAGLLGDLVGSSRVLVGAFALMAVSAGGIGLGLLPVGNTSFFFLAVVSTSLAIFALRGVYFALFGEGAIPKRVTGTAIGLVSVVGYTPDIFMGPLMGYLTDRSPGALGHQHVFGVVALFALLGMVATFAFQAVSGRRRRSLLQTQETKT